MFRDGYTGRPSINFVKRHDVLCSSVSTDHGGATIDNEPKPTSLTSVIDCTTNMDFYLYYDINKILLF